MSHFPIQDGRRVGFRGRGNGAFTTTRGVEESPEPDSVHSDAQSWLTSLPMAPCTRSIAQLAPDIANEIGAVWSDVSLTSLLLEQMLIGDGAVSLPCAVTSELLRLYEYHARCRANDAPDTT